MIRQITLSDDFVVVEAVDKATGMWCRALVPTPVGELAEEAWGSESQHGYRLKMDGQVLAQYAEPIR